MRFQLNRRGLTYTEVIIALPLALLSVFAAAATILSATSFNQTSKGYTQAMNLGVYRLEQIRAQATLDVAAFRTAMLSYNGVRFPIYPPRYPVPSQQEDNTLRSLGIGPTEAEVLSRVSMVDANLADVTLVVCYRGKNGQVIGEDKDFDGILDAGEDSNPNGRIDSPIVFHALVARK